MECDKPEGHLGAEPKSGSRHPRHPSLTRKPQLETLPPELWREIAKFLTPRSLSSLLRANRHFAEILTLDLHCIALQQGMAYRGLPILCWAISTENEPLARFLLARGVDANIKSISRCDETPLHYAAKGDNLGLLSLLLENGANTRAQSSNGLIPLHYAASGCNPEVVRLLLGDSTDLNAKDWRGLTPLHHAAFKNCPKIVDLLLEKGAELETRDPRGNTPLHFAVHSNRHEVIKLLLKEGANIRALNLRGFTPLHLATCTSYQRDRELLL